jgi:hypothetical protein
LITSAQTLNRTLFRSLRRSLAVALLAALAAPTAFAEGNMVTPMTPPAPNAANRAPKSENSLPENAETSTFNPLGFRLATKSIPAVRTANAAQPSGQ